MELFLSHSFKLYFYLGLESVVLGPERFGVTIGISILVLYIGEVPFLNLGRLKVEGFLLGSRVRSVD